MRSSGVSRTRSLFGREDIPIRVELTARDLAKLGQLYLNRGRWQERRIVSRDWVERATATHTCTNENRLGNPEYGYLWWRHAFSDDPRSIQGFQAQGAGGQFLFVLPELNTVAVFTSRNFGRSRQINPLKIMRGEPVPALVR